MTIYTKKGDKGKTRLKTGEIVWKDTGRVVGYGQIDELNSLLGVVVSFLDLNKDYQKYIYNILVPIQKDLFYVSASIANVEERMSSLNLKKRVESFEKEIDEMTKSLPILKNFILPGGGIIGANLQLARAVARRVEREIVSLSKEEKIDSNILIYMNRLSDLLFTISRFANFKEKNKEIVFV